MADAAKWLGDVRGHENYEVAVKEFEGNFQLGQLAESMRNLDDIFSTAIIALDNHATICIPLRSLAVQVRDTCSSSVATINAFRKGSHDILIMCRHLETTILAGNERLVTHWLTQILGQAQRMSERAEKVLLQFKSEAARIEEIITMAKEAKGVTKRQREELERLQAEAEAERKAAQATMEEVQQRRAAIKAEGLLFEQQANVETAERARRTGLLRRIFGRGMVDLERSRLPEITQRLAALEVERQRLATEQLQRTERLRVAEVKAKLIKIGLQDGVNADTEALRLALHEMGKVSKSMIALKTFWENVVDHISTQVNRGNNIEALAEEVQVVKGDKAKLEKFMHDYKDVAINYYQSWAALEDACKKFLFLPQPEWNLVMPRSQAHAQELLRNAQLAIGDAVAGA